jgi:hypothetical protein|uniref:Uncharacterized protein n=1 Tax=Mus musculus TaxID=10090 RepID=Q8C219_MOUSE|nr:unnamed protein product [Mus musculus]
MAVTMNQTDHYDYMDGTVAFHLVLCPYPLRPHFLFPSFSSPSAAQPGNPFLSLCAPIQTVPDAVLLLWGILRDTCAVGVGNRNKQNHFPCIPTPKDRVRRGGFWVKERKRSYGSLETILTVQCVSLILPFLFPETDLGVLGRHPSDWFCM